MNSPYINIDVSQNSSLRSKMLPNQQSTPRIIHPSPRGSTVNTPPKRQKYDHLPASLTTPQSISIISATINELDAIFTYLEANKAYVTHEDLGISHALATTEMNDVRESRSGAVNTEEYVRKLSLFIEVVEPAVISGEPVSTIRFTKRYYALSCPCKIRLLSIIPVEEIAMDILRTHFRDMNDYYRIEFLKLTPIRKAAVELEIWNGWDTMETKLKRVFLENIEIEFLTSVVLSDNKMSVSELLIVLNRLPNSMTTEKQSVFEELWRRKEEFVFPEELIELGKSVTGLENAKRIINELGLKSAAARNQIAALTEANEHLVKRINDANVTYASDEHVVGILFPVQHMSNIEMNTTIVRLNRESPEEAQLIMQAIDSSLWVTSASVVHSYELPNGPIETLIHTFPIAISLLSYIGIHKKVSLFLYSDPGMSADPMDQNDVNILPTTAQSHYLGSICDSRPFRQITWNGPPLLHASRKKIVAVIEEIRLDSDDDDDDDDVSVMMDQSYGDDDESMGDIVENGPCPCEVVVVVPTSPVKFCKVLVSRMESVGSLLDRAGVMLGMSLGEDVCLRDMNANKCARDEIVLNCRSLVFLVQWINA